MSVKLAGKNKHASVASFYDYNRPEHEQVTGSSLVSVFTGEGRLVGRFNRQELEVLARGQGVRARTRADSNPGEELGFTLPASVVAAMKHKGLLDTPAKALPILSGAARTAMRKLNEDAYGRTTDGKLVKVNLYYAVMYGFVNRAGEMAPQVNVWVLGYGQAQNGKHYAVDTRRLFYGQKTTQAVWHMAVTEKLLEHGITCVPDGNSIRALGYRAQTQRSKQVSAKLLATPFTGPAARARVVRTTRGPKPKSTWGEAFRNFAYSTNDRMERAVKAFSAWRQERFARHCIRAAFKYHNQSGAARYSKRDVYATGAHLALPQLSPEIYDRVFARLTQAPERMGAEIARIYPDGNTLYVPRVQLNLERKAGKVLWAGGLAPKGGLSRHQVAKSLAGKGLDVHGYEAVQRIADPRRVVVDPHACADSMAVFLTAEAYKRRGRPVFAVGKEAGKLLDLPSHSAFAFAEKLDRTPHLSALWQGLRSKGSFDERLREAGRIRRRKPPIHLKKNSLIVVSAELKDTRALLRILKAARKTGSKVVFTGSCARQFSDLAQKHHNSQRPKGARM